MSRQIFINITDSGATVVKVVDNNRITFEINVAENRQLKLEENNNRIVVLPNDNEIGLNNFYINYNEVADRLGTNTVREYYNKLLELRAFKKGGGGQADMTENNKNNPAYIKNRNKTVWVPSQVNGDYLIDRSFNTKTIIAYYLNNAFDFKFDPSIYGFESFFVRIINISPFDLVIKTDDPNNKYILDGYSYTTGDRAKNQITLKSGDYIELIKDNYYTIIAYAGKNIVYNNLSDSLTKTVDVNGTDIDWEKGVAFQVPELTGDTAFTFSNVQENKQIKIYLKGNYAFSFPANVDVSNVNYDGNEWNIIVLEAININGSQTIKAYSI